MHDFKVVKYADQESSDFFFLIKKNYGMIRFQSEIPVNKQMFDSMKNTPCVRLKSHDLPS